MKKSRFTDEQIALALKKAEIGVSVAEITRKLGITEATFYRWKKKFGGLMPSEVRRLKQMEEENRRLKQIVADLTLDKLLQQALKQLVHSDEGAALWLGVNRGRRSDLLYHCLRKKPYRSCFG